MVGLSVRDGEAGGLSDLPRALESGREADAPSFARDALAGLSGNDGGLHDSAAVVLASDDKGGGASWETSAVSGDLGEALGGEVGTEADDWGTIGAQGLDCGGPGELAAVGHC